MKIRRGERPIFGRGADFEFVDEKREEWDLSFFFFVFFLGFRFCVLKKRNFFFFFFFLFLRNDVRTDAEFIIQDWESR